MDKRCKVNNTKTRQLHLAPYTAFHYTTKGTGADESRWASRTSNAPSDAAFLIERFVASRRDGLSPLTLKNYRLYLKHARDVIGPHVTGTDLQQFINTRSCSSGGKHAYFRCLKTFYNWLYSPKSGYALKMHENPILMVDPPKVEKKILPSLTIEQLEILLQEAHCIRDQAIISLFADSGLRLSELASIETRNIDWERRLIKVRCKGNKEGYAPFGERTMGLMKEWLRQYTPVDGKLWDVEKWAIIDMLHVLRDKTGLPCNPHTFRRTFARILAKRGIDSLHIQRLGRWESLAMVERYTRSVRFDDSFKLYGAIVA